MLFFPIYKICSPSQYIVITGLGINKIKLVKKQWILPGQQYNIINISPKIYEIKFTVMSSEMIQFIIKINFIIGPKLKIDDFELYVQLFYNSKDINKIIEEIIEGKIRDNISLLNIKTIFENIKHFKSDIYDKVQIELNQFGLKIYSINLKQIDLKEPYLPYISNKLLLEIINKSNDGKLYNEYQIELDKYLFEKQVEYNSFYN
jgi:flotillin